MIRAVSTSSPKRVAVALLASGLVLAGCGTTAAVTTIAGTPSISIAVPLRTVACTATGICVAVGTSGADAGITSAGEDRSATGAWRSLEVPAAPSSQLTTSSCWNDGCLFGGAQPSGDLVWYYNALTRTTTSVRPPARGSDVSQLSCFAPSSCALVDATGVAAGARLSFTTDAGATWSPPVGVTSTAGTRVTGLSCTSASDCLAVLTTTHATSSIESTSDAGRTWTTVVTPTSWTFVSSLSCHALNCSALVGASSGLRFARSRDGGVTWRSFALDTQANAVACTATGRCVLVGQNGPLHAWLATLVHKKLSTRALQYVPSPLDDVACGARVCAAIAVSTLVALRP
ncbi:MAG TPA: hypothetical protein VMV53_10850 [Acidimicrobiales bacterium]|nr:hypothetical protein [Acidimicrobiales bacterium]